MKGGLVLLRVLVFEPGYSPYTAFFSDAAEATAKVVKGQSEVTLPFDNEVIALVRSKEQEDLPLNRSINDDLILKGRAFLCGWDGQRVRELSRKQADRYSRRYLYPEQFVDTGDALMAVPQNPRVKPADERLGRKSWLMER